MHAAGGSGFSDSGQYRGASLFETDDEENFHGEIRRYGISIRFKPFQNCRTICSDHKPAHHLGATAVAQKSRRMRDFRGGLQIFSLQGKGMQAHTQALVSLVTMAVGTVAIKIQRIVMNDNTKTPSQIADEAKKTGQKAADAAGQLANEAKASANNTVQAMRPALEDVKDTGRDTMKTAKGLASDAKSIAGDAWNTARDYAKSAGDVAGEKLGDMKVKAADFQETAARRISDEPLKAVAIGAAAGALLAALMMRRGRSRRDD